MNSDEGAIVRLSHAVLLGTLLILYSTTARAQDSETTTPWLAVSYGGGSYAMSDANIDIREEESQRGYPFDEISSGMGFDVGVGMDVGNFFRLGVHFQRMQADTSVSDGTETLEYRYPASAIYMGLAAMRPAGSRMKYGLELAVGLTLSGAEKETTGAGLGDERKDLGGTGPYFASRAVFDMKLTSLLSLTTGIGYRYAATNEMSEDGVPIKDIDGKSFSIDYSGFEAQAGIRFFFK